MTTDELRAKFEVVAKGYGYCVDRYPMDGYWTGAYIRENVRELWAFWQAAHASRDAEIDALRKDAEIGRYVLKYAAWIRDGDDTLMEIRFSGHVDLSSVGTRRDAIDAAMREDKE